jgi:hypothetical protein
MKVMLLGMASFAVCRAFFQLGMAILASFLMRQIFAKTINLSALSFCMTFFAIL